MNKVKLDKEEQDLLKTYDADVFESVITHASVSEIRRAAESTFKKGKRINIRIST